MLLFAACALAQDVLTRIEGQVLIDRTGLPLRRVQVVATPLEAGKPAVGTQTDERGHFELRDLAPGGYRLTAQRDGYLVTSNFTRDGVRMPPRFVLGRGEQIGGLTFRLHPSAVISGTVRYEDSEPAVNVPVELYRRYHLRGRSGFVRVATGATNDRGDYRVHGLAPGSYFVAVAFEGDPTGPGVVDQPRIGRFGQLEPTPSYATTFFPNTMKLTEATPLRLREGEEMLGIDLFLQPIERVQLSGRVTDGIAGTTLENATITLHRVDAGGQGTLPVPAGVTYDRDKRFHIADVAPGTYELWIDGTFEDTRLVGRSLQVVTNADIDNLEMLVTPLRPWSGVVIGGPRDWTPQVVLEPRSERGAPVSLGAKPRQEVSLAPYETYDVFIANLPDDLYIEQVRVDGRDVRASGLSGNMASERPFEIRLASNGGRLAGVVSVGSSRTPWSGATVTLIPVVRDQLQHYRETFAGAGGEFRFGATAPGRYIVVPWFEEPPCDLYDESTFDGCRIAGMVVDIKADSESALMIEGKGR
jgi:hypothetical protein